MARATAVVDVLVLLVKYSSSSWCSSDIGIASVTEQVVVIIGGIV